MKYIWKLLRGVKVFASSKVTSSCVSLLHHFVQDIEQYIYMSIFSKSLWSCSIAHTGNIVISEVSYWTNYTATLVKIAHLFENAHCIPAYCPSPHTHIYYFCNFRNLHILLELFCKQNFIVLSLFCVGLFLCQSVFIMCITFHVFCFLWRILSLLLFLWTLGYLKS